LKVISDDIKKGEFKSVYLLYGEEEYLKKQYRDRLKNAIAEIEKAASKGIFHKNAAARKVSHITKAVNAMA
jgi:ribosomal protein S20